MYFILYAHDRPASGALRASLREAHLAHLREHKLPIKVMIGGPILDEAGAMAGSVLVYEAADKSVVEAFVAADPYVLGDLFERVELRAFAWGIGAPKAG